MVKLKKNIALSESGFIFDPSTGDSYSVNQTGSKIIEYLKEGISEDQIIDKLKDTFDSDEEQIRKDMDDFLQHLKQLKMIDNG